MKFTLPENAPAELEVIGSCMRDKALVAQVPLSDEDFTLGLHKAIFRVIKEHRGNATAGTIHEALRTNEDYVNAGGIAWLQQIYTDAHPSAIKHNISLLQEDTRRRRLAGLGSQLVQNIADGSDSLVAMGELRDELLAMQKELDADEINTRSLLENIIEKIKAGHEGDTGIMTGFRCLDAGGGLETGLHSIHGASGLGKTALALNIVVNVLNDYPHSHVLHFSFEGSARSLVKRILARQANVSFRALRRNLVDGDGQARLSTAAGAKFWNRLHIIEHTRYANVSRMIAYAEAECLKHRISLITVDHLQLMETGGRLQNRHLEISKITRDLSFLAKDLDVPVIVFSQVNEEGQAKESRDIKAHSTNYFSLTKATEPIFDRGPFVMRLKCEKGRDTGTWEMFMEFDGEHMSFTDCDKPETVLDERTKGKYRGGDGV